MFVEEYLKDLRRERYRPRAAFRYVARCTRLSLQAASARPNALRGVLLAGLVHLSVLLAAAVAISFLADRGLGIDYFLASMGWLLGGLLWITLHLGMFRADAELPRSGLGLPNILTLGRLLTIPAFYLFITRGYGTVALGVMAVGALSDVADGIAARVSGTSTRLGKLFDPLVDILFACGIAFGMTHAGYLPVWILVLALVRYGLLTVGGAWIYVTRGPVAVRPTILGKATGAISSVLATAILVIHLYVPEAPAEQVLELLYASLGLVLALTIVQVVVMGIHNMRHAGSVPSGHGAMRMVVGENGGKGKGKGKGE